MFYGKCRYFLSDLSVLPSQWWWPCVPSNECSCWPGILQNKSFLVLASTKCAEDQRRNKRHRAQLSFCLSAESRPHRVKIANLNSLARTQINIFNFPFAKAGLMLGWGSPVCSFALTCFSCWLWKCLSWHCPLDQSRLRNRSFPNCHLHIRPWPELLYDLIIRISLGSGSHSSSSGLLCTSEIWVLYKFCVTTKKRDQFTLSFHYGIQISLLNCFRD